MRGARSQDLLLDLVAGSGGHRVRARGAGDQAGLALAGVPVDPRLDALAGDAHRCRDVRLAPAGLVAATISRRPWTVSRALPWDTRTSGLEWALDKPHPIRRFSFVQPGTPLPT